MDKRNFLKTISLAAAAITLKPSVATSTPTLNENQGHVALKAKALKKGDTLGIITPSSALGDEEAIQKTKEVFEALGFNLKEGQHIRARYGDLAGTDEQRIADIHAMFADPEVRGIVCIRGGSGASRLLDRLDYKLIANHPKVVLGYSDVTALLLAFQAKAGLIGFHGAVGTSTWTNKLAIAFGEQFFDNKLQQYQNPSEKGDNLIQYDNRIQTITTGVAEGRLIGGNLTLIAGLCGSEFLPDFKDAILFVEEVDENIERVDRLFCQLKNAGVLARIKGFIFGHCTDCKPSGGYGSLSLQNVLDDYIKPLGIPAYSGARIGHISNQFILPVGAMARMDAQEGTIQLVERALV